MRNGLNVEGIVSYTRTFARPRKEWSVFGQYAPNAGTRGYNFHQFDNALSLLEASQATYRERSRSRTPGGETTLQTDFTQPLGEKSKVKTGLKAIFRRTGFLLTVDTLCTCYGSTLADNAGRATDFHYDQQVQAAYGIYSFGAGQHLTASFGSCLERTAVRADFGPAGGCFTRAYFNLLPTASAE